MSNIIWAVLGWVKENTWDRWFEKVVTESIRKISEHAGDVVVKRVDDAIDKKIGDKDGSPPSGETTPPASKVRFKGLRSYDELDADFFPELLPGPRGQDGLPESIRFWKTRIEQTDPEKTFRVGVIYGPSGCGKSSLVKAGILPRLTKQEAPPLPTNGTHLEKVAVVPVFVEATAEDTEARLLRSVRRHCPVLPPKSMLVPTLREKRKIPAGKKVLIVLDQFEQWLHAKPDYEKTELVQALRECDGERVQCILLVRDDFWTPLSRFLKALEVRQEEGRNMALVDRFDLRHANWVLVAFGQSDGMLDTSGRLTRQQTAFVQQSITGLAQEGKIICVRLVLFAQMVKGKPWTPATLKSIGGIERVGVTFLDETFSDRNASVRNHRHEKAAQAILKALLPEQGADIKVAMRPQHQLLQASGYAHRPEDFEELLHILDSELRLITPTPSPRPDSEEETLTAFPERQQYYQLTHDYLVPAVREWLRLKQTETRRGRAELRLAERSSLWNAKPESRHLPSVLEWASIRLLTKRGDWTEPQRRMMRKAGWVHGCRTLVVLILLGLLTWGGIEDYGTMRASSLVDSLLTANTNDVPALVRQIAGYRRWANPRLKTLVQIADDNSLVKLNGSLALLPVDPSYLAFLEKRLLNAAPAEFPVIRDALEPHRSTLIPNLWSVLDSSKPGEVRLLPAASALADYDAASPRWESVGGKVAQALVSVNPVLSGLWLDALRPVRGKLNAPLAAIFRDKGRPEDEHSLATNFLTNYASDDLNLIADLLMDTDPKAFAEFFPIAQRQEATTVPSFQREITRKLTFSWNDPPLDPSWIKPDASLDGKIASALGMLAERFAFCQTMPLDEFLTTAEAIRPSGYRPIRFRPYADGKSVRVAAVWTRDGRPWRMAHDQSADEIRQTDERNRKEGYLPFDVAGYLAAGGDDGKPTSLFAALWAQRTGPDDDARMVLTSSVAELTKVQEQLMEARLFPLSFHAWRQADDKLSYSGVWHKTATGTSDTANGLSEADLPGVVAQQSGSLIDLDLATAPPPPSTKDRATSALQVAEAAFKAEPDDLNARFGRATAHFQLGESQKAIDDLNAVIEKAPQFAFAYQYRAIAHARLGHKQQAKADLAQFQKGDSTESSRLYLAVVVAAELDEGTDKAFEALEAALKKQPQEALLHYYAACAYALATQAVAWKDQARGKSLSERALSLLRTAIQNGYSDYKHMQEDADLDPLRELPAFAVIMKVGHLDRSYAAVWTGHFRFEARPLLSLDSTAHLQRCRELVAQGYRMVALSVARTSPEGPPVTASVWHRPVITEETRDRLAERQARAGVALVRMGKAEEVWPLLRHSADPRLRSFIVNWLSPLGADPKILVAELDRLPANAPPTPAEGQQLMDAILFHPETSQRRALILALGTYGTEELSSGEREPLIGKLLDLYCNDPDSGIHGAVEWTLRQWKQDEKLRNLDAEFSKLKDQGNRRWYVNSQGQTFAVIEGPVEFQMGSPPNEPERLSEEILHRRIIPRRFAIATQEVTVEQYQEFVKENPVKDHANNDRYSPDPKGPMNGVRWYHATAYCNWLSRKENLPECYEPNDRGQYAEGMKIRADALQRTGYRLPTEAEWEYGCRAGAGTSRYYGSNVDLLGRYAWYRATSGNRAWACGSLLPNNLGMFDMLGNVNEWCQDRALPYGPGGTSMINDNLNDIEYINDKTARIVRGGSFDDLPAFVRSALRLWNAPSYRNTLYGFRPSRTYP